MDFNQRFRTFVFKVYVKTSKASGYIASSRLILFLSTISCLPLQSDRPKGYCFVYFESLEDSKVAKEQCSGMEIDGRRIRVDFSITQRAHTPTPGIYMGKPTHLQERGWDGPRRRE